MHKIAGGLDGNPLTRLSKNAETELIGDARIALEKLQNRLFIRFVVKSGAIEAVLKARGQGVGKVNLSVDNHVGLDGNPVDHISRSFNDRNQAGRSVEGESVASSGDAGLDVCPNFRTEHLNI